MAGVETALFDKYVIQNHYASGLDNRHNHTHIRTSPLIEPISQEAVWSPNSTAVLKYGKDQLH